MINYEEEFKKEFPILWHLFAHVQGRFKLKDYRVYQEDKRLILLETDKYHSITIDEYLQDFQNPQGWRIRHAIAHVTLSNKIGLELVLEPGLTPEKKLKKIKELINSVDLFERDADPSDKHFEIAGMIDKIQATIDDLDGDEI